MPSRTPSSLEAGVRHGARMRSHSKRSHVLLRSTREYVLVQLHSVAYRIFEPYRSESLDGARCPKCNFRLLNLKLGDPTVYGRDAVGSPNFVFSRRKLHFGQRAPSSDSLLYYTGQRYGSRSRPAELGGRLVWIYCGQHCRICCGWTEALSLPGTSTRGTRRDTYEYR
eukprot:COSAG02_NODE_4063_length_5842_cov_25.729061_3_plen_168_part_00